MRMTSLVLVGMLALSGCTSASPGSTAPPATESAGDPTASASSAPSLPASDGLYPDVVAATATRIDDGRWRFTATLSSPYDTPERYADAWRVVAPDGTELGVRELAHDHAGEQPFTRSLSGVEVPDGVDVVVVQGRDQVNGWGGQTVEVAVEPQDQP